MNYEVKEFYDSDNFFKYRKMCSTLFRVPIPVNAFRKYDDGCFVSFDNSEKMKNEIKDIYSCFSQKRNMSVVRCDADWDKFFAAKKAYAQNKFSFVSYTDEGADGFMCFSVKQNEDAPPFAPQGFKRWSDEGYLR